MERLEISIFLIALFLVVMVFGCAPSERDIQTAIVMTEEAKPINTSPPLPTNTPKPMDTPIPTEIPALLTCSEQAVDFLVQLDDLLARWDDARDLASVTARIALSGPIAMLQEIKREAEDIEPPDCAAEAHEKLLAHMESEITSYRGFAAQGTEHLIERMMATANAQRQVFEQAIEGLDNAEQPLVVHYIVTGDVFTADIQYIDENGEKVGARPILPWTYGFQTEPGTHLSVSANTTTGNELACGILVNGGIKAGDDETDTPYDIICEAIAE